MAKRDKETVLKRDSIIKEKAQEFYKEFYDKNRIPILQYESLRKNFQKMINEVLGDDYYNYEMDVYECDRQCCEDITRRSKGFFKNLFS